MPDAKLGGLMDADFIYGLITGILVGLVLLWLIQRKRNS
jgi:F0F1-type ATP synthase assembly protein I